MVDVKKRTERMLEEARKKLDLHIRAAKESEGKPQFPLSVKLKAALPLVAIVVALYSWSYYYTDVRQIFAPEEKTDEPGPADLPPSYFGLIDDEDLSDALNKKW